MHGLCLGLFLRVLPAVRPGPAGAPAETGSTQKTAFSKNFVTPAENRPRWAADHIYKHNPTAILVFTLMTMLAFNLFYAFYRRNLQPAYRSRHDTQHVARCLSSELYGSLPENRAPPP